MSVERLNPDGSVQATAGRMVEFFHPVDRWWWPALILQVEDRHEVDGSAPTEAGVIVAGEIEQPPSKPVEVGDRVRLQVFRPRANEWVWAIFADPQGGEVPGTWRWLSR